jgi:hypothetical protein
MESWLKCVTHFRISSDEHIPTSLARVLCSDKHHTNVPSLPEDYFYAVLTDTSLTLFYDVCSEIINDAATDHTVYSKLSLQDYMVNLVPDDMLDFEFYAKHFPIQLMSKRTAGNVFYLYMPTSPLKEEWFLALRRASGESPAGHKLPRSYSSYFQTIDSGVLSLVEEGVWFNYFMERLFITKSFSDFLHKRLNVIFMQKVKRSSNSSTSKAIVAKSNDLTQDSIWEHATKLSDLNITGIPKATKFSIVCSNASEGLVFDFNFDFEDEISARVQTMYQFDNLLASFDVPVGVTVKLTRLSGRARFQFKPPPSNRIWIAFHSRPSYEIDVVPEIASYGVRLSLFSDYVRTQIDDGFMEFVLPNMSDIALSHELADGEKHLDFERIISDLNNSVKDSFLKKHTQPLRSSSTEQILTKRTEFKRIRQRSTVDYEYLMSSSLQKEISITDSNPDNASPEENLSASTIFG